jgi:hypothetical protein
MAPGFWWEEVALPLLVIMSERGESIATDVCGSMRLISEEDRMGDAGGRWVAEVMRNALRGVGG